MNNVKNKKLYKSFIIILTIVLSLIVVGCSNDDTPKQSGFINNNTNRIIVKDKINRDFSYIYDSGDFTYDVTKLIIDNDNVILPDLSGMSRAQIKYILDKLGVNYKFKFDLNISLTLSLFSSVSNTNGKYFLISKSIIPPYK